MSERYSEVTIRATKEKKKVKITSAIKPKVIQEIIDKWQDLLNITASIINVPSGLIMKLNEDTIEVFLKSNTDSNPYYVGETAKLVYGLYCETVIGTQNLLAISNAAESPIWKENNPDVEINMISYLGYPINWPDGEVFGTVCLLDNKENYWSKLYEELLLNIKKSIETDLQVLMTNTLLEEKNAKLEQLNDIKAKFLALISHDVRGAMGNLDAFVKLILSEFNTFNSFELHKYITSLSQSVSNIYITLENMTSWSKNELLLIEPQKREYDILEMINNILVFFQHSIFIKQIEIVTEYSFEKCFVNVDKDMFESALRNIISNALKYNVVKGKLFIRVFEKSDKINIEIEDTGIGMQQNQIEKLFSYDELHYEKGTSNETSSGIGLLLIKEFLEKNDAIVEVESKLGFGTKFTVKLKR